MRINAGTYAVSRVNLGVAGQYIGVVDASSHGLGGVIFGKLFGDNSPSISWVERLASKRSLVAKHLVQALALQLKIQRACPLTTIHIAGRRNAISDVPS